MPTHDATQYVQYTQRLLLHPPPLPPVPLVCRTESSPWRSRPSNSGIPDLILSGLLGPWGWLHGSQVVGRFPVMSIILAIPYPPVHLVVDVNRCNSPCPTLPWHHILIRYPPPLPTAHYIQEHRASTSSRPAFSQKPTALTLELLTLLFHSLSPTPTPQDLLVIEAFSFMARRMAC